MTLAVDERFAKRNPEREELLRKLAAMIDEELPEGLAFGLFLVEFGESNSGVFWISNADRAGMTDAVRGWIADNERRAAAMGKDKTP